MFSFRIFFEDPPYLLYILYLIFSAKSIKCPPRLVLNLRGGGIIRERKNILSEREMGVAETPAKSKNKFTVIVSALPKITVIYL
jgi:hypothetical protein